MTHAEFDADRIRRSVVQRLEDLRRAGVTHWKKIEPAPVLPSVAPQRSPAAPLSASRSNEALAEPKSRTANVSTTNLDSTPKPMVNVNLFGESESSEVARKKAIEPVVSPRPCAPFQPLNLSLAERVSGLAALSQRVAACTRCHELASTRTQTVFGVGNPEAKIMFVGEAPGADEDKQGEPFVGRAGQLLNDVIKACRMRREDIYICNVLRCRPPGNRLPAPDEAANCREYLDGQIAHVNPDYIVCWGACAAQNLLSLTDSIGKLRGRFYEYGRAKVVCTYHPSYLLRNPAAKKDVWEDMKRLFLDMGIDLTVKPATGS